MRARHRQLRQALPGSAVHADAPLLRGATLAQRRPEAKPVFLSCS
jgi:hypothetical protein